MHDQQPSAEELAALRDAVLGCHEELARVAVEGRGGRAWRWLAVPWMLVDLVRAVAFGRQPAHFVAHDGAVRLYRQWWERSDEREEAAVDRYVAAWRRWLDRQAQPHASVGGDG